MELFEFDSCVKKWHHSCEVGNLPRECLNLHHYTRRKPLNIYIALLIFWKMVYGRVNLVGVVNPMQ